MLQASQPLKVPSWDYEFACVIHVKPDLGPSCSSMPVFVDASDRAVECGCWWGNRCPAMACVGSPRVWVAWWGGGVAARHTTGGLLWSFITPLQPSPVNIPRNTTTMQRRNGKTPSGRPSRLKPVEIDPLAEYGLPSKGETRHATLRATPLSHPSHILTASSQTALPQSPRSLLRQNSRALPGVLHRSWRPR